MAQVNRHTGVRAQVNNPVNLLALGAAILAFSTGLLLLTYFHAGAGSVRDWGLGQSRLVWVNFHRLPALALIVAIAVHGQLHWRPIAVQFGRVFGRTHGKVSRADLVLYLGFAVVSGTGFMAWFAVPGSPPLFGPVTLSHTEPQRLFWIDLHHWSGLIVLRVVFIHVRRRFRSIRRAMAWREG